MNNIRFDDFDLLHPKMRIAARLLAKDLAHAYETGRTKTLFKVFETYRGADRQLEVFKKRTSKARPFESAHQFGLAVDFVAWNEDADIGPIGWNWNAANEYGFLAARAQTFGLSAPIQWDPGHVEHPLWEEWQKLSRR